MKKLSYLFSLFVLLTAFTCENEPLEGDFTEENELSCEIAAQNTQDAAIAFLDVTDANYTQLCIEYRNALEVQIQFCGDPDGILQTQLNSLGTCVNDIVVDDCVSATAAVGVAQAAFALATDDNYVQLCNIYRDTLLDLIAFCGNDGGTQSVLNGLGNCEPIVNPDPCEAATNAATQAGNAYNANTADSDLCNAYESALQNQIVVCGDTNGSIQAIIDSLGDCSSVISSGTLSVTTGTLNIQFITTSTAVLNSGIVMVNGSNTDQGANYFIEFEVPEGTTGIDVMQNFILTLNGTEYFPDTSGFDDFTNNITVNSGGVIQGTFGGIVTSNSGGNLSLSQGIVDMTY
ncbi:hypothetical protein [Psychroserpens sp.]|uniref:hypothetical protein n=1 Tax=Psychroserpens sp. TaxID=2020870 RepID=UPI00385D37FD